MNAKILDTVQKLFALAKGTHSEEEAFSAMTKAQELMALHGISELDLKKRAEELPEELKPDTVESKEFHKTFPWYWGFAKIVADATRCFYYRTQKAGRYEEPKLRMLGDGSQFSPPPRQKWIKGGMVISFLGTHTDASIAAHSYDFIIEESKRSWSRYWKSIKAAAEYAGHHISQHRDSYYTGFAEGLKKAYEENVTERGLMIVKPDSVIQARAKIHTRGASTRGMGNSHAASSSAGYKDGMAATGRRGIGA